MSFPVETNRQPRQLPSAERLAELFTYHPHTGLFSRRAKTKGVRDASQVGHLGATGYLRIHVDGRRFMAHRLAWVMHYKAFPPEFIDHINGDTTDNRLCNLRAASYCENVRNSRSKSKRGALKGTSLLAKSGRWRSQITVNGKNIYLGRFCSEQDAHDAYVAAAKIHHGEFARAE